MQIMKKRKHLNKTVLLWTTMAVLMFVDNMSELGFLMPYESFIDKYIF